MGAFFLFKSDEVFDVKAVRKVFADKGSVIFKEFTFGDLTLWLFRKQLIKEDNYLLSPHGSAIFAVGTVVYKAKSYCESLSRLLDDFEANQLDYDEMIGAFCLIFLKNRKVYILTDRANICHIFVNSLNTMLSSSFLALLSAQTNKLPLNKLAFLEQLLIGYIAAPDTSLSGIYLADALYQEQVKSQYFTFISCPNNGLKKQYDKIDFNACVRAQLDILKVYYNSINLLATQYGVDIGLSGGYDSRLNLLLAISNQLRISAHTHVSAEHHIESRIAELLATEKGIALKAPSVRHPQDMAEEEIVRNLEDSLIFYDGRTNKSMGTFNDVHTKKYRIASLNRNRLGLNALGGELYRNYDYTFYNKLNFVEWIKYHVMDPCAVSAIHTKSHYKEFIEYILAKYIKILNVNRTSYIDKYTARRYYAEIWLPYSAGIKSHAENQLAFFLMPFTEHRICQEALKATPYIGRTGRFEAAMLMKLDRRAASLPSSYGFGFDREPLAYLVKSYIRGYMPDRLKNILGGWKIKLLNQRSNDYLAILKQHATIRQCIDLVQETQLPIAWDYLFMNKSHFERAISVGYFLWKFRDKISW